MGCQGYNSFTYVWHNSEENPNLSELALFFTVYLRKIRLFFFTYDIYYHNEFVEEPNFRIPGDINLLEF
jgi:hypothetical protein